MAVALALVGFIKEDGLVLIILGVGFFLINLWQLFRGWFTHVKGCEVDGKLYDLGTCDMKGGIAAAFWAVANAPREEIKAAGKGIKLCWTYDE